MATCLAQGLRLGRSWGAHQVELRGPRTAPAAVDGEPLHQVVPRHPLARARGVTPAQAFHLFSLGLVHGRVVAAPRGHPVGGHCRGPRPAGPAQRAVAGAPPPPAMPPAPGTVPARSSPPPPPTTGPRGGSG